jgi:energy-coupling factor transporter ATP-binding protein EcfA2
MITRLEVDGFKSLQGFAVDLEPFTVFIGPNGAGKSNILEALALLGRLASMPIVDAFKLGRGRPVDQFSRYGDEVAREVRFAVEFLFFGKCSANEKCKPNGASRFRYELVIERETRSSGTEHLKVQHEQLRTLRRDEDAWIDTRDRSVVAGRRSDLHRSTRASSRAAGGSRSRDRPEEDLTTLLNQNRRRRPNSPYALFGEQVRFETLHRLSAFVEFETALVEFVRRFGAHPTGT